MGIFNSKEESEIPESFDKEGIKKGLHLLGTVNPPSIEDNPSKIDNNKFNENCALESHLKEITVKEPDFLNKTLIRIAENIERYLSDELNINDSKNYRKAYPLQENSTFRYGVLTEVNKNQTYDDYQIEEYLKKNGKLENLKKILRGFSVYEFNDDNLKCISQYKQVELNEISIGIKNGKFTPFAPEVDYDITNCLKISWWVYILNNNEVMALPGTGQGIIFNKLQEMRDFSDLSNLENYALNDNEESLKNFYNWEESVKLLGKTWAYCGGEVDGELIPINDFFDMVAVNKKEDNNEDNNEDNKEDNENMDSN